AQAARRRLDHHRRSRQRGNHDRSQHRRPAYLSHHEPRAVHPRYRQRKTAAQVRRRSPRYSADAARRPGPGASGRNVRHRLENPSVVAAAMSAEENKRLSPAETKLIVCVKHPFSEWCAKPLLADAIREHWPKMRVVYLPNYDKLPQELPEAHIFVGASLRSEQFAHAKQLKWIHSTAAGVSQLMYPQLFDSGVMVTNP